MPDYLEQGFFAKVGAWHNKGVVADRRLTREEAYNLSGQNYEVIRRPIHVDGKEVIDHFATVRADTGAVLGVVGDHALRKIIQNKSLYDVLEPVVAEGEAVYETGGVLKSGAVVWALAQLEKHHFCVGKEDLVKMYTLTALAHDGSRPFTGAPTAIRVVCWNTISIALSIADGLDDLRRDPHRAQGQPRVPAEDRPSPAGHDRSERRRVERVLHRHCREANDFATRTGVCSIHSQCPTNGVDCPAGSGRIHR
jgi:phage/plasmid-like protein (TIGR03299 family)